MKEILTTSLFIALLDCFLIILINKWRIIERVQMVDLWFIKYLPLDCQFCISFWIGLMIWTMMCLFVGAVLNVLILAVVPVIVYFILK
jgi:hypothetical protein